MLSFSVLENKFGAAAAYHYLTEIERAARIRSSDMAAFDPEARFIHACRVQDSLLALTHGTAV